MKIQIVVLLFTILCICNASVENLIYLMKDQVDLDAFAKKHANMHVDARAELLVKTLVATAKNGQSQFISWLDGQGIQFTSYHLPSFVAARMDRHVPKAIMDASVRMIIPNSIVKADLENVESTSFESKNSIDWNVKWIKASDLHEKGITGKGMVVANSDTGIKWNHPALLPSYRGRGVDGSVNHNYAWWDALHHPIDKPENVCGYNLTIPCDDYVFE